MDKRVAAVVPAAGRGVRMGTSTSKQFLTLGGVPLFVHALRVLNAAEIVTEIVLVVPEADRELCVHKILPPFGFQKVTHVVNGGQRRQDSVRNGLAVLRADTDFVLVHDAVRPFLAIDMINKAVDQAMSHGAAVVAVPMRDTVKRVGSQGLIESTCDREELWLAQTPQVFRFSLLMEAHQKGVLDGIDATDDASLVERLGQAVAVVNGTSDNIKITKPEDVSIGEAILIARAQQSS